MTQAKTLKSPEQGEPKPGQVARKYQEEIFRQAQKGNIITYLRTGLGKTLISVLLLRWMCTQEKAKDQAIIFLVPKVSLVEQQAFYIHKETGLKTCRLHGAMTLNFGDREGWKKRFKDNDVFVSTPHLFLEMITHSVWSIDKCSLIIFDECHHARKNHPYNGIMREYKQVQPVTARPKIFGMTASPYWNQKNPALSLLTLEENLDSKIVGVHEHIEELQNHYAKMNEVIVQYPHPEEEYDFPQPTLFQCLKVYQANDPSLFDHMDIAWTKVEMRYYTTLNNLGPYCASLYLFSEMQHHFNGLFTRARKILSVDTQHDAMSIDVDVSSIQPSKLPPIGMFDILDVLDGFEPYFLSDDSESLPIPVPLHWCTPKVRVLVDLITPQLSKSVQTIIFVEQRQTASCIAKVLKAIPDIKGLVRCGHLVGYGTGVDGAKQTDTPIGDPIKLFREKKINILIATSVAEEGLDFPACELVIRFDPLQHLVGYVQSRGRARSEVSKYVVMIQQDNIAQLERYKALQKGESELSHTYHTRSIVPETPEDDFDSTHQDTHPIDLAERERYVVPVTGAILTYDNAMGLINHLCSLIPRDAFTPPPKPEYSGDFQSRMRLPAGLPLSARDRIFIGYPKRSKKEAKRSVAFQAVRRLLKLNVFNDYLLPTSKGTEDAQETGVSASPNKSKLPPGIMEVNVREPWYMGTKLWSHPLLIDSNKTAALITGTSLPPIDMSVSEAKISLLPGTPLVLHAEDEDDQRQLMQEFTKFGIWSRITAKPFTGSPTFFVVPLTPEGTPDFEAMRHIVENQKGSSDWSDIGEGDYGRAWVFNWNQFGRIYLLKTIRHDLSTQSVPPPGSIESGSATYYQYFVQKWTRKKREARVPADGPLLEAVILNRNESGLYDIQTNHAQAPVTSKKNAGVYYLPRDCCKVLRFPEAISKGFTMIPVICRGITDLYRVQSARFSLRLPPIAEPLILEALTIPATHLGYDNQRLETLGDAVLQLCTTVHALNLYPNRHEGQLTDWRKQHVSNRYLLRQALDIGLERFVTSEVSMVGKWRYTTGGDKGQDGVDAPPRRSVRVEYPRRSLQDCMEALLGASFWHGGIPMALVTGTALGVQFGGPHPWEVRYRRDNADVPVTALFDSLQEKLGYSFHSNDLIVEAVTHPSFASSSGGASYQRLEFLGDAILDLVVVEYLYNKFPKANSHQLSFLRSKVICAPALGYLAVKKLGLHKTILINNMELYRAIDMYVPLLEAIDDEEVVRRGWKYDPPKVISDVFESVIGAVLVDSNYNYEKTAAVTRDVMFQILEELSLSSSKDPVSELTEWIAKRGCRQKLTYSAKSRFLNDLDGEGIVVQLHSKDVVGPIVASSLNVARFIASEQAFALLSDSTSDLFLEKLCDCKDVMVVDPTNVTGGVVDDANVTVHKGPMAIDQHGDLVPESGAVLAPALAEFKVRVEEGDD